MAIKIVEFFGYAVAFTAPMNLPPANVYEKAIRDEIERAVG